MDDTASNDYPTSRKEALAMGSQKYHGKACRNCGTTLKFTSNKNCVACQWRRRQTPEYKAYQQTPERKAHVKAYQQTPEHKAHDRARRRLSAAGARMQPQWANKADIEAVYLEACLREATEGPLHVDHIIPLNGKLVSGLHVANNLQILPRAENQRKRAYFNPWTFDPILGIHVDRDDDPDTQDNQQ